MAGLAAQWIPQGCRWRTPTGSSISAARQRVGSRVMTQLFFLSMTRILFAIIAFAIAIWGILILIRVRYDRKIKKIWQSLKSESSDNVFTKELYFCSFPPNTSL